MVAGSVGNFALSKIDYPVVRYYILLKGTIAPNAVS